MMTSRIIIRQSEKKDKNAIEFLMNYEFFVHQHVDWRPSLDWLGNPAFHIASVENEIFACLSMPNEVENVAWIRLFACSSLYSKEKIWDLLFDAVLQKFEGKVKKIFVLGIHNWFVELLKRRSFSLLQNIIVLEWYQNQIDDLYGIDDLTIHPVDLDDLSSIVLLDKICFSPIWQLPSHSMKEAYFQAGYFTKAVLDGKIIGYQLCTETSSSAHLARLAVDPEFQGKNFGKALVQDLLQHYRLSGINQVTVNTQDDNLSSQALYKKLGFQIIEEKYPVLILEL